MTRAFMYVFYVVASVAFRTAYSGLFALSFFFGNVPGFFFFHPKFAWSFLIVYFFFANVFYFIFFVYFFNHFKHAFLGLLIAFSENPGRSFYASCYIFCLFLASSEFEL